MTNDQLAIGLAAALVIALGALAGMVVLAWQLHRTRRDLEHLGNQTATNDRRIQALWLWKKRATAEEPDTRPGTTRVARDTGPLPIVRPGPSQRPSGATAASRDPRLARFRFTDNQTGDQ